MNLVLLAAVGGGIGSVARYLATALLAPVLQEKIPLVTVGINTVGSLLLGFLLGQAGQWGLSTPVVTFVGAGILGGFTTFSTASFETIRLLLPAPGERVESERLLKALAYGGGTLVLAWLAAGLGLYLGGR